MNQRECVNWLNNHPLPKRRGKRRYRVERQRFCNIGGLECGESMGRHEGKMPIPDCDHCYTYLSAIEDGEWPRKSVSPVKKKD
jgi:hypothetical protein